MHQFVNMKNKLRAAPEEKEKLILGFLIEATRAKLKAMENHKRIMYLNILDIDKMKKNITKNQRHLNELEFG